MTRWLPELDSWLREVLEPGFRHVLVVGVVLAVFQIGGNLPGGAACIAIVGLLICTGSFAIGLGPVFWLLISEICPVKIRARR